MRIRAFTLDDHDAAVALWDATEHVAAPPLEELARLLEHAPDLVLVAEEGDRLVGVVLGSDDGRRGWLFRLAVAPDRRREGVGRALVEEVERRLVERGATRIRVLVVGANASARRFWDAAGYTPFEDIVMYSKDIVRHGEQLPEVEPC